MAVSPIPPAPEGKQSERIKIQDVARLAQVSLSTLSGVLNEKENVRPETRQRVLEVIARLGYTPNLFARI